jgi:mRNA interferase YafQ
MKYIVRFSGQFKKSFKLCKRRGYDMSHLETVIRILSDEGQLPAEYKPHILSGKYAGIWECHVEPDWLLLWTQNDKELILLLLDTGTHSDIF